VSLSVVFLNEGGEENISDDDDDKRRLDVNKQFKITLIETPRTSLQEIVDSCQFCDDGKDDTCSFNRDTTCGYYQLMSFVDPQSCVTAWRYLRPPEPKLTEEGSPVTGQLNMTWVPEPEAGESKRHEGTEGSTGTVVGETNEAALLGKVETPETDKTTVPATLESMTMVSKNGSQENDTADRAADAGEDPSRDGGVSNSGTDQDQAVIPPPAGSIPDSASKDYHSADKPSGTCSETTLQEGEATADTVGRQEAATGQVRGQDNQPAQDQTVHNHMVQSQPVQSPSQEQQLQTTAQSQNKTLAQKPTNIYAEIPSKPEVTKDYELDGVPMDEITYQKLSSRGKESAFIKLKNRIKLLEMNLNLTNR